MEFIKDILRGVMIGIANAIPGVSGGTMMVSMGIYDKIISSVTGILHNIKKSIKTLLPYIIGMMLGIVGLSFVIEYLFDTFPLQTALLFIGLILGGLPIIFGKLKGKAFSIPNAVAFIAFFALIILLQVIGGGDENQVTLVLSAGMVVELFVVGVIAAATMVIPGVSGSMILMLLGFYTPVIEMVTTTVKALAAGEWQTVGHQILLIIPFGVGVVLGVFAIAKLIEVLLAKKEALTYSAILGLVVASPIVVLMQIAVSAIGIGTIAGSVVTFVIGFTIAFFLGRE